MRKRSLLRFVAVASLIGAAAVGSGSPAIAETVEPARDGQKIAISQGMTLVDIDEKVAQKAGFEVVRDDSGKAIGVKRPGEDVSTSGYDMRRGDCGYSYIQFEGTGGGWAHLRTGFFVYQQAISYYWRVDVADSRGVSRQEWGGGLNYRQDWEGVRNLPNLGRGSAWAGVNTVSNALLWWGGICVSAGPNTTTWIS